MCLIYSRAKAWVRNIQSRDVCCQITMRISPCQGSIRSRIVILSLTIHFNPISLPNILISTKLKIKAEEKTKNWCQSGTVRIRTSALVPCGSSDLTAKAHRTSPRPSWQHSAPISWSREIYSARDHAEDPHYQHCPGGATLLRPAGAASVPAQPPGCGHHPHWQAPLEGPGWPVSDQLCCERVWCSCLLTRVF